MKWYIILILTVHLLGESWILFGDKSGNNLVVFLDGKSHGVILWWYIKGLNDQLLFCTYCFTRGRNVKGITGFFRILFIYHAAGLIIWLYNYSTSRWLFLIMLIAVGCWAFYKCWPHRGKLIKML